MNKICGIYKITSPTNKIYIGSSKDIVRRWRGYRKCTNQIRIFRSIEKYGIDAHKFEVIHECNEEDLFQWERLYAEYYDVLGVNGLNLAIPEYKNVKRMFSVETREKMSKAKKGIKPIKALEAWIRNNTGKPKNREAVKKTADALRGIPRTQELKNKISNTLKGRYSMGENFNAKIVLNTKTGIYYDCGKEAAKIHNIKYYTFKKQIYTMKGDFIYA